jgi:NitT/TauT family transport system ATP-binding protein
MVNSARPAGGALPATAGGGVSPAQAGATAVMAGLVPAIHVVPDANKAVDARTKPGRDTTTKLPGAAIDIEDVSHRFDLDGKALPVIDRVSLRIEPGELVSLLGPSGCGKSTLLRLVAGLEPPSQGRLLADAQPITGPDPSRVVMFQDPTLYPWRTVKANVSLGLEAQGLLKRYGHRVEEALTLVGLSQFATAYPHQLSGGMAQRVSLARALVNDPRLLLLDEPLGKLDSMTRVTMQQELVALWRRSGFTALLVTHDVEEAIFMSNRVIVLSPRPAAVLADIPVDLPFPRHRGDPRVADLRRRILGLLGLDADW